MLCSRAALGFSHALGFSEAPALDLGSTLALGLLPAPLFGLTSLFILGGTLCLRMALGLCRVLGFGETRGDICLCPELARLQAQGMSLAAGLENGFSLFVCVSGLGVDGVG